MNENKQNVEQSGEHTADIQRTWADRNEKPKQWAARSSDAERMEARRRRLTPQVWGVIGAHIIASFLAFLGMNLLALVMSEGVATVIGYAAGIFSFVAVLYTEGWHAGDQDVNMMNYGHIKRDKLRGLKAACIGESFGLLFAILMVAHGFVIMSQRAAGVDPSLVTGISKAIPIFYHVFYLPFLAALQKLEEVSPFFCLLPVVVAPAIYHLAYTLGMKHYSISEKLMYKKQDDK